MAAGDASRLGSPQGGKGFVSIVGLRLIDHLIREAREADVRDLCFYVRAGDFQMFDACVQQYAQSFDSVRCLTAAPGVGTGGAMLALSDYFGSSAHAICALDLFAAPGYLKRFLSRAEATARLAVVAVTDLAHDDAPIYVETDGDCVTDFGKEIQPSRLVFGHLRWYSNHAEELVREAASTVDSRRDSLIVRKLIQDHPRRVSYWYEPNLFDIDDFHDLQQASEAARAWTSP